MNIKKRESYLDIIRIASIAFVVLLHSINGFITNAALYGTRIWYVTIAVNPLVRTGVPLFLMISGYLILSDSRTLDVKSFYKHRFRRILIPFLTWDAIYFITNALAAGENPLDLSRFIDELLNQGSKYHLWYVYTITAVYLFAPFLKMIVDKCTRGQLMWLLLLTCFCGTIRPFINTVTTMYIYLFDPIINGYFGYFILGYILGTSELTPRMRNVTYLLGALGFAFSIYSNISSSSAESINLSANGGYAINQFACAAALFVLAKYLPQIKNARVCKILADISNTVYGTYLSHILIYSVSNNFTHNLAPWLNIFLSFSAALFIPTIFMLALSRVKYINKIIM